MSDGLDLDLVTLSGRLMRREVSAVAVVEGCLNRIQRLDEKLNAFRRVDVDRARAQAKVSDARTQRIGPLDGIPIAAKDNIGIEGLVTRSGLGLRDELPATADADIIRWLRDAGAIILGHTNMHEGALGATTDNPHYGRTHNPWRYGHTPGGSSGGSAAAVAARLCPLALGTDTMGSIRLPASYCGLAGYKPGRGQIDNGGIEPLCKSLDQVGPISRSVADLGLWCEALTGSNPAANSVDLRALRIARLTNVDGVDIADDVRAAFDDLLTMLEHAGVDVMTRTLQPCDLGGIRLAGLLVIEAEAAAYFRQSREHYPNAFSPGFGRLLDYGATADEDRIAKAKTLIADVNDKANALFEETDLIIMPTAPQAAFSFDDAAPSNQADLTALANIVGAPAVSLPVGLDQNGLPIGIQVIGPKGTDSQVLAASAALEDMIDFQLPDMPRGDWP